MLINQNQRFAANKFPKTWVALMLNLWIAKKKFLRETCKAIKEHRQTLRELTSFIKDHDERRDNLI